MKRWSAKLMPPLPSYRPGYPLRKMHRVVGRVTSSARLVCQTESTPRCESSAQCRFADFSRVPKIVVNVKELSLSR